MTRNERWHLVGGLIVAIGALISTYIGVNFGIGFAVIFLSVFAGIGVELYQKLRKEGTPSFYGAFLSSLAGLVIGTGIEISKW